MTLSEKIRGIDWVSNMPTHDGSFIHVEDVKEFIKELKESDVPFQWLSGGLEEEYCRKYWKEYIDELAGSELT